MFTEAVAFPVPIMSINSAHAAFLPKVAGEEAGVPAEPLGREDAEHPLCERRPQRVPLRQRSARQSPGTPFIIQCCMS